MSEQMQSGTAASQKTVNRVKYREMKTYMRLESGSN
jgi:hypothetical protein